MSAKLAQAFIFARGGSKGVPRKNIKPLNGTPLIAYSIDCALSCPSLGHVVVSTDDNEIAEVSKLYGAEVPFMRPAILAGDSASEWHAWRHAVEAMENLGSPFEILVSLPTTSPFRAVEDVEACLMVLDQNPDVDVVITVRKAERSPYFNMVQVLPDGNAEIVCKSGEAFQRRQDVPEVFDITTVAYAVRTKLIKHANGLFEGKVRAVEVPAERALDIDTPYDFLVAELLAKHIDPNGSRKWQR
ncbi:MAG TPA: acylneuraminate cytidylyltransferase family protein [Sphingorhabdus sp.]|jgi:CMP-N-acetylneuraminic acid synthetase|uniref:acylneuraminate cytidylyltransferase family protein n=1 Tax=Sphingorhabdus sp. TaxID=1902408 RepID=UPI002BB2EF63|nr:acylneuraminate cytidylyltransferase family protein [Sphingorhabdus sp.]HMT42395.1 acylneuraminate cytidylyltransferase family protein [Sphingorhabdus sp.]HMU20722.1 acylneuraminate cytidylyltransferase family protein [Sphingorhabdus sp.]